MRSIELSLQLDREGKEFIESAENIAINTRYGIEKAWWRSGKDIQGEFNHQVLDKASKTGRIYIRRDKLGRRRRHQASAPGQTPANRTGNYRKAFDFVVRGWHELAVGNAAEYAGYLEEGTSRMRKRPGLGNAIQATERDVMRNLYGDLVDEI